MKKVAEFSPRCRTMRPCSRFSSIKTGDEAVTPPVVRQTHCDYPGGALAQSPLLRNVVQQTKLRAQ